MMTRLASFSVFALLWACPSCSVLPPRTFPPADEREVVVHYELTRGGPAAVRVPASGDDVTVLWLETEPAGLRESFDGGVRRLHLDGPELVIRCRYRAYGRLSPEAGQRALPEPEQLFPGATSIETVWHRDRGAHGLQSPAPR